MKKRNITKKKKEKKKKKECVEKKEKKREKKEKSRIVERCVSTQLIKVRDACFSQLNAIRKVNTFDVILIRI